MIKKKSMLALLLIAAMLCTCLPVSVLASDAKITYGLFDGAVVDAENIMFGVSGITEAPSVTIGGVAIDSAKITYANGNVTVDATNEGIAFGINNITVKSGDDTIFSGNIVLDKFAASVNYGGVVSSFTNDSKTTDNKTPNTYVINSSETDLIDFSFLSSNEGKTFWTNPYKNFSYTTTGEKSFGVYDLQFKANINKNIGLGFQVFAAKAPGSDNKYIYGTAAAYSLTFNGYIGGIKTNEAFALGDTNEWYTFDVRVDQQNAKLTVWVTKDGGTKTFVTEESLRPNDATFKSNFAAYGLNSIRLQVMNRSNQLSEGGKTFSDTSCQINKNFVFTHTPVDTFKIDSVKADDVALTANDDGAYTLSPVTDTVEVTFNTAITGTVTLGSNSVAVNGGKTAKFNGLNLTAGDLALTVPASATTVGLATLGNKFVSPFSVSNEFAVASPVEGGSYKKGGKIFSIYEADKTVSYKLNGTALEKDALAENVKLGNNTLEILVDSTEYKRISFNVTDTVIYGKASEFSPNTQTVEYGANGTDDDGTEYRRYTLIENSGKYTGVQINATQKLVLLRDQDSADASYDARFLSGRFVSEMDMRFVKPSTATSDSADVTVTFRGRENTVNDVIAKGLTTGTSEQLKFDRWYNVKAVMDMNNKTYEFYIDNCLIKSITPSTDYLTADDVALIQFIYTAPTGASLDLRNGKFYFEVPVGIENVTYGSGTALSNGTAPVSSTVFGVTTQLRIPDDQINTTNIQLLVDGENVATAVAQDISDSDYLGAGTEKSVSGKVTSYYKENGNSVGKPLWYSGTKGTKINLTASVPANAKKGEIVIKAGTKVIATDWKNVNVDDNGKVTSDTSATPQKLITLSEDVAYPVYFTDNGVYAELSQFGNNIATTIITDGTQSGNTIMKAIAKTGASSFDVSTEDYTITAGEAAVATDVKAVDTTSATTAKAMLWFKNSLKPIVDVVNLK